MPRNKLAGKFTGKSKSSKYFANNPEARAKKNAYNIKYHSTPERRKYRGELVQERRDRGIYGKGGKDVSHTKSGKTVLEDRKSNRSRNGKGNNKRLK